MTKLDYEITWIPLNKLTVIWRKAQRPYDEKWAKQIADEFDPDKFEPVIVTMPNGAGVYHIIEGQHRKGAAEIALGLDQTVPCRIVSDADPARAAEIWLGISQGRKAVRAVTEFLVAVEAKRELETAINAIVKKAGYRIVESSKGTDNISAVGALRKVYAEYGSNTLLYTLQMTRLLWGADPHGVSGRIITGLGMFINEFHSHIDGSHLQKVIINQYKSPWKFIDAVKLEAEKSSETFDVAMSELIRSKYNKALRIPQKKLLRKES